MGPGQFLLWLYSAATDIAIDRWLGSYYSHINFDLFSSLSQFSSSFDFLLTILPVLFLSRFNLASVLHSSSSSLAPASHLLKLLL
ncbi:hypothetical protein BDW72DRAFT_186388 [Aspergillus terricola var. indicus]